MGKAYDRVMESRKELTKQLISEMSQGELCWIKGWNSTGKRPYNPITKAVYKGGNRFRLMLAAHLEQYTDNRWVTFAQAKEKGWTVKKGEKGMLCEKWIFEEKKTIEDPITGEKETVYEELEHPKVNYFVLFNAAQVEGMPALEKQPELPKDEQLMLADRFVRSSACPVIEQPGETEAYYSPERDEVHLPMRNSFYSSTEFLATAIHEMSHSTGHSSRLNRPQKNAFGSKEYAKEELIAELSSVFVQADLGIDIGAKNEIYKIIDDLAKEGVAVILLSSEMPEILSLADRIMVMHHGYKRGELMNDEADQVKILSYTLEDAVTQDELDDRKRSAEEYEEGRH